MELASAFAAPPVFQYSPRVAELAARKSAVGDGSVAPVAATTAPATTSATAHRSPQEHSLQRRMTAEDFSALQAILGINARGSDGEDPGIPGEVTPAELLEVIDREDDLAVVRTADEDLPTSRDFSDAVADAVVTVDEYLDWVLETGVGGR